MQSCSSNLSKWASASTPNQTSCDSLKRFEQWGPKLRWATKSTPRLKSRCSLRMYPIIEESRHPSRPPSTSVRFTTRVSGLREIKDTMRAAPCRARSSQASSAPQAKDTKRTASTHKMPPCLETMQTWLIAQLISQGIVSTTMSRRHNQSTCLSTLTRHPSSATLQASHHWKLCRKRRRDSMLGIGPRWPTTILLSKTSQEISKYWFIATMLQWCKNICLQEAYTQEISWFRGQCYTM